MVTRQSKWSCVPKVNKSITLFRQTERETGALFLFVSGRFCLGFGFDLRIKISSFLVSVRVGKWAQHSWRCLGKSCLQGLFTRTLRAPCPWVLEHQPHTGELIQTNPCLSNGIFQALLFWLIERLSSDWNISFCLSHCAHQREKFTEQ